MGRMLILAVAIVFSVSSAYAQSEQQVQTAFAAVNPVVGSGVGLMVFGRVGHRDGDDVFQSTVWAASVVINSALVVSSDVSAGENAGIAIVNPSNFTANITLTLRNQQGTIVASRANLTGMAQTVRIDFYNPEGVIIATLPNVNVPPAGVTVINR